jgi:CBS domain-containing protein
VRRSSDSGRILLRLSPFRLTPRRGSCLANRNRIAAVTIPDHQTFLARLAPFNQLSEPDLARLADELKVGHFQPGEILQKTGEVPACLYLIVDGLVYEVDGDPTLPSRTSTETAGLANDGPPMWCVIALYGAEDVFDAGALLEGTGTHSFVVGKPTRCLQMPRPVFLQAVQNHPSLAAFYNQKISQRLAILRETNDRQELATFTIAKIQDVYIHPPVFVTAEASIHEAALAMKTHKINSVLVQYGDEVRHRHRHRSAGSGHHPAAVRGRSRSDRSPPTT